MITALKTFQLRFVFSNLQRKLLRVVQTQAILFSKSMPDRVGSDIERLWILKYNLYCISYTVTMLCITHISLDSKSIESNSESFYVGSDFRRHWFQQMKWFGSGLPLISNFPTSRFFQLHFPTRCSPPIDII